MNSTSETSTRDGGTSNGGTIDGSTSTGGAPDAESCAVLICDDQEALRNALSTVLAASTRFHVVAPSATDGVSCVERVAETHPDLLILDVNMPGGGPQVPRAVKAIDPNVYILVFSGRQDADIQSQMIAAGADEYVVKTGRLRPLLDALNHACDQHNHVAR